MKKLILFLLAITMIASYTLTAQVAINTNGTNPDGSAMLDVKSNDKGVLIPRMTQTQMEGITSPATGLSVYNTDVNAVCYFNGTSWDCMDAQSLFEKTFFCGDILKDFRDGQRYTTVQIGTQCWMAENLNIGTMINGSSNQTDNGSIEKYCYSDNTSNCDTYGGLYQWDEMMQYVTIEGTQGICPAGWHLPTDAEWCTLENEVDVGTVSCSATGWRGNGSNLKEKGTTHWTSPNTGATNSSGFTGLPAGFRTISATFFCLTDCTYFWTSSEDGSTKWIRSLSYEKAEVLREDFPPANGFSVRCVRD